MSNQNFSICKAEDFDNWSNKESSEKKKSKENPNTSLERHQEDIKFDENDILNKSGTTLSDRNSNSIEELNEIQSNKNDSHNSNKKSYSNDNEVNSMNINTIFESSSMNKHIQFTYYEPMKLREAIKNNVTILSEEERRDIVDDVYNWTWDNLGNYIETTDKYRSKYELTNNMYGLFKKNEDKDKILKSVGVYEVKGSNMLIFTITKCYSVIWEIYIKHFNADFAKYILDFLNISEYVYLYEILDWTHIDFNNSWGCLKHIVQKDQKINELKSIVFRPYYPKSENIKNLELKMVP